MLSEKWSLPCPFYRSLCHCNNRKEISPENDRQAITCYPLQTELCITFTIWRTRTSTIEIEPEYHLSLSTILLQYDRSAPLFLYCTFSLHTVINWRLENGIQIDYILGELSVTNCSNRTMYCNFSETTQGQEKPFRHFYLTSLNGSQQKHT